MSPYLVGIDPGTGVSSPTGFVVFNRETKDIEHATTFKPKSKNKFKSIPEQFKNLIPEESSVCIETFVMRGKGGQTLQQMIGAYMSVIPDCCTITHIYNTSVKKFVGGSGKSDKHAVALGVGFYFRLNFKSRQMIESFIENEQWDILDAFAIAIAGEEKRSLQSE